MRKCILAIAISWTIWTPNILQAHERDGQALTTHLEAPSQEISADFSQHWESHYFSEGRDNLDGESLSSTSLELNWSLLSAGFWYGYSPNTEYDELQVSFASRYLIGDLELYAAYTHLRFPNEGGHDHEFGLGAAYGAGPLGIEYALDFYHSLEADGWFAEASLEREFEITEKIAASLGLGLGLNQGYVADGHDGANHLAATLGLNYQLSENISVRAHATHSWAMDRDGTRPGDDALEDFFHAGFSLHYEL